MKLTYYTLLALILLCVLLLGRVRPEKTMDELYDAYEELLERKRQEEQRYR